MLVPAITGRLPCTTPLVPLAELLPNPKEGVVAINASARSLAVDVAAYIHLASGLPIKKSLNLPAKPALAVPVVMIMQYLRVDMSMMLIWYASDIIEYDRRRSWLPSASLNMEYDNNRTEE